jgi:hypothetical protein
LSDHQPYLPDQDRKMCSGLGKRLPDPSGQDANAYLYVGGNPVNFVDPSGLAFLGIDCPFGETGSGGCNGANDFEGFSNVVEDTGEGVITGAEIGGVGGAIAGCVGGALFGPPGCFASAGAVGTAGVLGGAVVGGFVGGVNGDRR